MKILVRILVIMIFTLSSNKAICQNIEVSRKKNSFLISGASSIMLNGMYSFDYERNVYQKGKFETLLRFGYGDSYFIDHGVLSCGSGPWLAELFKTSGALFQLLIYIND